MTGKHEQIPAQRAKSPPAAVVDCRSDPNETIRFVIPKYLNLELVEHPGPAGDLANLELVDQFLQLGIGLGFVLSEMLHQDPFSFRFVHAFPVQGRKN